MAYSLKLNAGQSILEVIVAMAIFSLIGAAMVTMVLGGFAGLEQGGEHTQAEALAQEGIEAVRSIRDGAWNENIYSTSSVATSSGQWVFSGEGTTETIGQFTRTISFNDVCRDSSNDITTCPGSYTDVQSKEVVVSVDWEIRSGVTNSVQRIGYLTNWDSQDWTQTDWTGQSGTNIDTSTAGELKLTCGGISDGGFDSGTDSSYDWAFTTPGNYIYDSEKIEVTGGVAQLKESVGGTCSGTSTICSSQSEGVCSSCGCSWSTDYCSNSGSCAGCGSNPQCKPCQSFGCSWRVNCLGTLDCSLASDEASCTACSQCSWNPGVCNGTPSACSTHSDESSCTNCGCVWSGPSYPTDSPNIYPNTSFSANGLDHWDSFTETAAKNGGEIYYQLSDDNGAAWQYWNGSSWVTVGGSDYNTASVVNANIRSFPAANEQIKFRAFLESDGAQLVQLDNINIVAAAPGTVWSYSAWDVGPGEVTAIGNQNASGGNPNGYVDITVPQGNNDEVGGHWEQSFTTYQDNPSLATVDFDYKVIDFNSTPDVLEIRIYIDTESGTPVTQAGSSISVSGEGDWAAAAQIDAGSAIITAGVYYLKIAFWAETSGGNPGPYTVGFDNLDLNLGDSTCSDSGYLISSSYDLGDASPIQVIEWDEILPSGTDIKFEIRAAATGAGLSSESWSSYFNTAEGELISTDYNGKRWVQYRVELTSDGTDTPVLEEVRINFK